MMNDLDEPEQMVRAKLDSSKFRVLNIATFAKVSLTTVIMQIIELNWMAEVALASYEQ